jgi:hypothetical protein
VCRAHSAARSPDEIELEACRAATSGFGRLHPALHDPVLDQGELVRRQEDGRALSCPLPEPVDEELLGERVEADHRLVEDEEARLVEERLREGDLLPRPV